MPDQSGRVLSCRHEGTGTAGVIRCRFCGTPMGDNGVRIAMKVTLKGSKP